MTMTSDIDLFADATLIDTPTHYAALRALGPIVYLPANDLFAVTHYDAVRAALRADTILSSAEGVAANEFINSMPSEATLISDGDVHKRRRNILVRPLMPGALAEIRQRVEDEALGLVKRLRDGGGFCGVRNFASHLPLTIVAELVGLSETGRESMLDWAAATFDALGPMNKRTETALQLALGLYTYVQNLRPEDLRPDGWAARIMSEAAAGHITPGEASGMIIDYTAPSLDTTILATAHMLWRLGSTPGAYDQLRANPDLVPSVVNESVRLASPIREFTRYAKTPYQSEAGDIPAGARVAILYASANWDEQHYTEADRFQIDRNPRDHVGWGHGSHVCAGMHLARLEMEALLRALLAEVTAIEVGEPVPILNNVLQGFQSLPAKFE